MSLKHTKQNWRCSGKKDWGGVDPGYATYGGGIDPGYVTYGGGGDPGYATYGGGVDPGYATHLTHLKGDVHVCSIKSLNGVLHRISI